jgi:ribosome-binding factor A
MSAQTQRQRRAGELIRHALAEILSRGEVSDPVLEAHVVTVPEVRMSPDLKHATAYVMPLGGQDVPQVLAALEANKKYLRGQVARRVHLKFSPDLRFRADESFEAGARMDALLDTETVQQDARKSGTTNEDGEQ